MWATAARRSSRPTASGGTSALPSQDRTVRERAPAPAGPHDHPAADRRRGVTVAGRQRRAGETPPAMVAVRRAVGEEPATSLAAPYEQPPPVPRCGEVVTVRQRRAAEKPPAVAHRVVGGRPAAVEHEHAGAGPHRARGVAGPVRPPRHAGPAVAARIVGGGLAEPGGDQHPGSRPHGDAGDERRPGDPPPAVRRRVVSRAGRDEHFAPIPDRRASARDRRPGHAPPRAVDEHRPVTVPAEVRGAAPHDHPPPGGHHGLVRPPVQWRCGQAPPPAGADVNRPRLHRRRVILRAGDEHGERPGAHALDGAVALVSDRRQRRPGGKNGKRHEVHTGTTAYGARQVHTTTPSATEESPPTA